MKKIKALFLAITIIFQALPAFAAAAGEKTVLGQEDFKELMSGYLQMTTDADGYIDVENFNAAQQQFFGNKAEWLQEIVYSDNTMISFETNSSAFTFEYKKEENKGYVEIFVNGSVSERINVANLSEQGNITCSLSGSKNRVDIYMPRGGMLVRNFAVDKGSSVTPIEGRTKALFYGDSITYGVGVDYISDSYVSQLSRKMNYESVNVGVSGYVFDGPQVISQNVFEPDIIFVAYGTNDANVNGANTANAIYANGGAFFDNLRDLYPTQHIYVITPIWANDTDNRKRYLSDARSAIETLAGNYDNITVIDGLPLVPQNDSYFMDGVHPNLSGATAYADNLSATLEEIEKGTDNNEAALTGWSSEVIGDFGTADVSAEASDIKMYSGSCALSIINMNMTKDENKYLEVKNTLKAPVSTGDYTLTYYVSKHRLAQEPDVFLGGQKLTVSLEPSEISGWNKYTANINYTGDSTDTLSYRFYYMVNSYFIDDVSLTPVAGGDNLINNPGFEGTPGENPGENPGDTPGDEEPPEFEYPSVDCVVTDYQPAIMLLTPVDSSLVINWKNPATAQLKMVSIYDLTDGKNELITDEASAVPSASVYHRVDGLTKGKEYQYKVVFSYNDRADYTYFIGGKLDESNTGYGAWTAMRVKNKGVKYSPTLSKLDTSVAKDGSVSLKILSNIDKTVQDFDDCYIRINQTLDMDLTKGNKYKVSFWVKGQNLKTNMMAHMSWTYFDGIADTLPGTNGTTGWTYKEYTYTCGDTAKNMFVFLYNNYADAIWIDDVKVYKMENGQRVGENLVKNGSFEDVATAELCTVTDASAVPQVNQITLNWKAPAKNYKGANIYTTVDGHNEYRGTVSQNVTEITIDGLAQGKEYKYLIAPLNADGVEGEAVTLTATTLMQDYIIEQPVLKKGNIVMESLDGAGEYTITVNAKNNLITAGVDCEVYAAVYNGDTLEWISSAKQKVTMSDANSGYTPVSVNVTIPEGGDYNIKLYVFDTRENLNLYYMPVYY